MNSDRSIDGCPDRGPDGGPVGTGAVEDYDRPWAVADPGRLVGRGHGAGDVLEAWKWTVLEKSPGLLVIEAHLPDGLKNPKGQLFGGFTATYVDFVSLHTVHTLDPDRDPTSSAYFLSTINMRCDYFEPIMGPSFVVKGEVVNQRGLTSLVSTKFFDDATMLAHAITTLRRANP